MSNPSGVTTPDGAPWGMYVYNIGDSAQITSVKLTYWIIGDNTAIWTARGGHSSCWSGPTRGAPTTHAGDTFTPYVWSYTCSLDPMDRDPFAPGRLHLKPLHMTAAVTQSSSWCSTMKVCTDRYALVDPDGSGSQPQVPVSSSRCSATAGPASAPSGKQQKTPDAAKSAIAPAEATIQLKS